MRHVCYQNIDRRVITKERFTAEMTVFWHAKENKISIEDIGVAPVVVLSWNRKIIQSFAETADAQLQENWLYGESYPLYTGKVGDNRISFANISVGAPATVMAMEEMIACGAKAFIGFGFAGSLQEEAPIGSLLIPGKCIRDEGTSYHYLSKDVEVAPSARLKKVIQKACIEKGSNVLSGLHWTTDAVYMELVSTIKAYRKQGVLGVDMETSAMYALGIFRKVEVCNLLVVSDEIWKEWAIGFASDNFRNGLELAKQVILCFLEKDFIELLGKE